MRTSAMLTVVLVCAAIAFPGSTVRADSPSPAPAKEYFPQPSERESQLDAALDQHLSIDFHEQPLADVANWFSSKLEVPVVLDHRSLEDAGVGSDTPVTRKIDGIRARAALELVLDDMDLAYLQNDGVLTITTQDSAEVELITRVYPVEDLTPLVERRHSHGTVGKATGGGMVPKKPADPGDVAAESRSTKHSRPAAKPTPDYDSLIEVITTTVKPQTWDEVGGPGSISEMLAAKSIVVSQTQEVHDEVLVLLRALRAAKLAGAPTGGE